MQRAIVEEHVTEVHGDFHHLADGTSEVCYFKIRRSNSICVSCVCHKHFVSQLSWIFSFLELSVSSYSLCHIVPLGVIPTKEKTKVNGSKWKMEE